MKIKLQIDYNTNWGQTLWVTGSAPELGNWNEAKAKPLVYSSPSTWTIELDIKKDKSIEYRYFLKENDVIANREWGTPHRLQLTENKFFDVHDLWSAVPQQQFLYTSGFQESFFTHEDKVNIKYLKNTILLKVTCPYVKKGQALIITGSSKQLGEWDIEKAARLTPLSYGEWQIALDASKIKSNEEYKFAILDETENKIIHWEVGGNHQLLLLASDKTDDTVRVESIIYNYGWMNWKAAGVAIPVFSLRSNDSFGVGEFSDLKKMVDWAERTGQKIIQILPINDTTITYTWIDSYPYNAISIYALHPIYLGLKDFPLQDKALYKKYKEEAEALNALKDLDYEKVLVLKRMYLKELFAEMGNDTFKSKEYKEFYEKNEEWLFPYACFSYFRDKYKTADFSQWKAHGKYNKKKLEKLVSTDKEIKAETDLLCFTQYLLHMQLSGVKEYANQHNVILKGDIPIGISRNSVDAWVEPHLFNLDVQTGAPPDDFSFYGQNWGFPTYNWDEMAKDGYQWWVKRFKKMADYFDAYRIDHILGFFRIWEIPLSSVQGLLGYFSPALPMTIDEIRGYGVPFDGDRMLKPYIYEHYLGEVFGDLTQEVIEKYLQPIAWQRFELKEEYNTQEKIKNRLIDRTDEPGSRIRDGLYSLCNEVLFIRDKRDPERFHPRITAQYSHSYRDLDDGTKSAFNRLYDEFFYRRHSYFWREQAMKKLPTLISSTSMLVCGEDLGMVPESVPSVMRELQILSLEIERMPKDRYAEFNMLQTLPYLSVCTTSTHDMAPLRAWWHEDRAVTQKYYNLILWKQGLAPEDCTSDICWQIVTNHLNAPSMLTILPIQDWLSIDDNLKRPDPNEERINIPAVPTHYWRYRMHLTLEDLIAANDFNNRVQSMIKSSGRE